MKRSDVDTISEYIDSTNEEARTHGYTSFEGLLTFNGKIVPRGKLAFDFHYDAFRISFDRLDEIKNTPGLYQIHTIDGRPLKVGIAKNLRRRLKQHYKSSQNKLKSTSDAEIIVPNDLVSKQSILAKHMFFDRTLAKDYDLKSESGRREFLTQKTYLIITYTHDRDDARRIEKIAEGSDMWRYNGRVNVIDV